MEEWQVCDDQGFIFKCRKKQCLSSSPPPTVVPIRNPIPGEAEMRVKEAVARQEKMATLLAQKAKYVAEIEDWERLLTQPQDGLNCDSFLELHTANAEHMAEGEDSLEDLRHKHQDQALQLQAYERFIEQLKLLCDQGESICEQLEANIESDKICRGQDLLNEVGQTSPRTIIQALQLLPAKS